MQSYEKLAKLFSELDQVRAVVIAGSHTAKIKDEYSDYDIYIYHDRPLSRETRQVLLDQLGGVANVGASFFEEGDEVHFEDSPYLDIMYRDVTWIDNEISDVWERCNARLGYTTCFIFNLVNSHVLFDRDHYFENLRKRVLTSYPKALKDQILFKNLTEIDGDIEAPYLKQLTLACRRGDLVSMNHRLAAIIASVFDVLFAYSEVLHPGEKKLEQYLFQYDVRIPKTFIEDLHEVLGNATDVQKLPDSVRKMMKGIHDMIGR